MTAVPLSLRVYAAAAALLEPFAPALLSRRARRGKEDPARLSERLGRAGRARPPGPLAWLHGASVGESLSLLPLIDALRGARPDLSVLVTSGTATSAELLQRRLPADAIHQFVPVDAPAAAARFLDHWRPDLAVFVESELWPNLLLAARARGVSTALLSARLSEASLSGWGRAPAAARALLSGFGLVMAQDDDAAARLSALGAPDHGRLNLKLAGEPPPVDTAALAGLRTAAGPRPVLLAASTHPGEEAMALDAFARLADRADRPLLVIVPRHPDRGADIAAAVRDLAVRRQGAGEAFDGEAPVYVADALGELGAWFGLARSALIGGSLVPGVGGHNPIEAARLGTPMISGPHVENWKDVYATLSAADGVTRVDGPAALTEAWTADLDRPDAAASRAGRAHKALDGGAEALDAVAVRLLELAP